MIVASFSQGWQTFRRRWGVLVAASALVMVAVAPVSYCFWLVGHSAQEMAEVARRAQESQASHADVDPAQQGLDALHALMPCCGGMCGDLLFMIFLLAPVIAGASVSAAQAAAGRGASAHLFCGFRRYWATVWVGTLCLILGGGIVVVATTIASIGARAALTATGDAAGRQYGTQAEAIFWVLVWAMVVGIIWFSARLWFPLYRLLDPARHRVTARHAVAWSWRATAGARQWRVLAVLLLLAAVAGSLQMPCEWAMAQEGAAIQWTGVVAALLAALLLWMPLTLAVSGALYEHAAATEA